MTAKKVAKKFSPDENGREEVGVYTKNGGYVGSIVLLKNKEGLMAYAATVAKRPGVLRTPTGKEAEYIIGHGVAKTYSSARIAAKELFSNPTTKMGIAILGSGNK